MRIQKHNWDAFFVDNNSAAKLSSGRVVSILMILAAAVLLLWIDIARAAPEDANSPIKSHNQTFIISAYYSPIKGQDKYVTGSYAGDIRLNGSGVNGADGTPVYPGMIAAPKTYAFGTKMLIPGIGTVAVHDRGGAIVSSGARGNAFDRLDIWMGYGDIGLRRALKWGKRTVPVTVYGVNPSIIEKITLEGYSESEKNIIVDSLNPESSKDGNIVVNNPHTVVTPVTAPDLFSSDLSLGNSGEEVRKLQEMLKGLSYYDGEISAIFDKKTYEAVSRFQIDEKVVSHASAYGAGYVGPRTMSMLTSKGIIPTANAKETKIDLDEAFKVDLKKGDKGENVIRLQSELRNVNLLGIEPTGYYGEVTEHAVFKFQQIHKLAGSMDSKGAGIFGPMTRSTLNSVVGARLATEHRKSELT